MGTYLPEKNAILSKQNPCRWLTWSGTIVASQSEAMIQNTVHQLLLINQQRHSKAWMLCWLKKWHIVVTIYTNTSLQANNLIKFTHFNIHSWLYLWLRLDYHQMWYVRAASEGEKVNTGIYQNPVPKIKYQTAFWLFCFFYAHQDSSIDEIPQSLGKFLIPMTMILVSNAPYLL